MKEIFTRTGFALAFCLVAFLLFMAYFWWISYMAFFHQMPTDISEIKIALISGFTGVIGYVIGSSASSAQKNETINKAIDNSKTETK